MGGKGWGALSRLLSTAGGNVFVTGKNERGVEKKGLGDECVCKRLVVVVDGCGCSGTKGAWTREDLVLIRGV